MLNCKLIFNKRVKNTVKGNRNTWLLFDKNQISTKQKNKNCQTILYKSFGTNKKELQTRSHESVTTVPD